MALMESEAAASVTETIEGFWRARVLAAAAQLGVPDAMGGAATTSDEVAERTGCDPRAMFRLMRALACLGVCTHHGGREFELTQAGMLLRSDLPASKYGHAAHIGNVVWNMFGDLDGIVRQGGSAVQDDAAGFDDLSANSEALAGFHMSLERESRELADELLTVFDFSQYRRVMDIGGGYGGLLQGLLEGTPDLRGEVFDLPVLESDARKRLVDRGLGGRAGFVGGDFFKEVPSGADAYLLKYILHDWDDEPSVQILQACRKAAGANGVVLIVERLVPDRVEAEPAHADVVGFDLVMMAYGGQERTIAEYRELMARAGLTMGEVATAPSGYSIIVGTPALTGPDDRASQEQPAYALDQGTATPAD